MNLPVLMLALFLQTPTTAQDVDVRPDPARPETAVPADAAAEPKTRAQPPQAARPVTSVGRRKGSMVGYIEDATIGTQFRIRFDAGWHNSVPDRAEFFYAKCGCYRTLDANSPALDKDAPGPGPGVVTDLNFQQAYLRGEVGMMEGRASIFAELPLRWVKPQSFAPGTGSFTDQRGLSDLRGGIKLGLVNAANSSVTVQLQGYFPTGDAAKGLGTDHFSLEPALLFDTRVNDRVGIAGQIGDWHPFGGSAGVPTSSSEKFTKDVIFYGIGPSVDLYRSDQLTFTPIVELVGWRTTGGFQTAATGDAGGVNIVNIKFGARTTFAGQSSIYVGWGHRLTTDGWYDDIFRVEFRRNF